MAKLVMQGRRPHGHRCGFPEPQELAGWAHRCLPRGPQRAEVAAFPALVGRCGFSDGPGTTAPDFGASLRARAHLPTAGKHSPPPPTRTHRPLTPILDESKGSPLPATSPSPPGVARLRLLLTPGKPQRSRATVAWGSSELRAGPECLCFVPLTCTREAWYSSVCLISVLRKTATRLLALEGLPPCLLG